MRIPFNIPPSLPASLSYIQEAVISHHISGDGAFTKKCSQWIASATGVSHVLLTTSCSHALDMSAFLCNIEKGDEVIMPSYTFSSTANAFVGQGAKIVFVDIRPDTMNIDETLIESAITSRTKVIVVMHYAGVSCEMDSIQEIARKHGLLVVEDAAQGVMSTYNGAPLGSLSDFATFSFHETKNFSMGEGGAILVRDPEEAQRAEVIREKGTNRSRFFRGEIDKYTWMDWGSSYLPSDLNAAYLWAQLEQAEQITMDRMRQWQQYWTGLLPLREKGLIELPHIPTHCKHNAHMFYIKAKSLQERSDLIAYLKGREIASVYHYVPLHSAQAGICFGRFHGEDRYTTRESERLLRLPLYYQLSEDGIGSVIQAIHAFYQ